MLKFMWDNIVGIGMFLAVLVGPTALYALLVRSFEISWSTQRIFLLSVLIPILIILVTGLIKKILN